MKKEMIVDIRKWGSAELLDIPSWEFGLVVPKFKTSVYVWEVFDKKLFFLMVIKYGIQFEEV
jgi:hypothetical protein